jgi:hypothetical protein
MSLGKVSALIVALVAAVAFGVWIGPNVTERFDHATPTASNETAAPAPVPVRDEPGAKPRVPRARPNPAPRAVPADAPAPVAAAVDLGAPELQKRMKTVLNRGADVAKASSGFRSAEQFATVAHAARNTQIPFMLLKHRVLNEGKTLTEAIKASKPDADAAAEAREAQASARRDLQAITG